MAPTTRKVSGVAAGRVVAVVVVLLLAGAGAALLVGGDPQERPSVAELSDRGNPARPARVVFATTPEDGLEEFPQKIHPERISVVDDPTGDRDRKVLRFEVQNSDTGPTENPRAQLETPFDFREGDDRYAGFSYYFPSEFPSQLPPLGWVTLGTITYGPPYDGAGPVSIRVQNAVGGGGAQLRWQRNDTYGNDIPWTGPELADVKGRWIGFVIRTKLHHDPSVGFVELWMNTGSGWRQQELAGRRRLSMATYDDSNGGGLNNSRVSLYFRKDIPGPLALYHGGLTVASAGQGAFLKVAPPVEPPPAGARGPSSDASAGR